MKSKIITLMMLVALFATSASSQPGLWSFSSNISNNSEGSGFPAIAIGANNTIHVVWEDNTRLAGGIYNYDILYRQYNGQVWLTIAQISAFEVTTSNLPRIALDSRNRPHVVWIHHALTAPEIYYATLTDSGWSAPLNISQTSLPSVYPDVKVDSRDHVHVFWGDGYYGYTGGMDIFHREFDGFSWLPTDTVLNFVGSCTGPRIAIDSQDFIHLCWVDGGNVGSLYDIGYSYFNSISWSPPVAISLQNDMECSWPSIALDANDCPHVVWKQELAPNVQEIYYAYSNGITWFEPQNITNLSLEVFHPALTVSNMGIKYLLYVLSYRVGQTNVDRVVFSYCQNGIWSPPDTVVTGASSLTSDFALGEGNVLHTIVAPMVSYGNTEIFYQYTTAGTTSLVNLLTPYNPPITIPAGGGSFQYDLRVENVQVLPLHFDLWTDVLLPNGHVSRTFLYRPDLNISAWSTIQRFSLTQNIPASCPPGVSYYRLMAGEYPNVVVAADSFAFTKEGAGGWGLGAGNWSLEAGDWSCSEVLVVSAGAQRAAPLQSACNPNPFNPTTTLRFDLPQAGQVKLAVYDVSGRNLVTLVNGWRAAGSHEVTFDAANLTSGVYIYRLEAGDFSAVGKMVLMK